VGADAGAITFMIRDCCLQDSSHLKLARVSSRCATAFSRSSVPVWKSDHL